MPDAVIATDANPYTIKYTPGSGNVAEGEVVEVLDPVAANTTGTGLGVGIAQRAIVNGVQGALAVGPSEWDVTAGSNLANYSLCYWDDTNNKVNGTSTNNSIFGFVTNRNSTAGDTTNTTVRALLWPFNTGL